MLRIHFTGKDLGGVRMAAGPDPLWETILSFHRIRDRRGPLVFGEWRKETRARLKGETVLLSALVPRRGYFPDFLTPAEGRAGFEAGLAALRATPPERVRAELALLAVERARAERRASRRSPSRSPSRKRAVELPAALGDDGDRDGTGAGAGVGVGVGGDGTGGGGGGVGAEGGGAVARGDGAVADRLGALVEALRTYHRAAIEPYWPHIRARTEADRALRGRALLDGGADELLGTLPPMLRWRSPVLEADYPVERELRLDGRGLLLQPSFFCRGTPVVHRDPTLPPVLVYPVTHSDAPAVTERPGPSLGRLVGHTRSAVLRAIEHGSTTSELARRTGVSLASASQHACVLREAGLVVTLRHGNAVLHTLTPLGAALLRGGATADGLYARN
ncbi:winged helix-turn-helix domain-containing protein [Streptomyces sp. NBC_00872]|nr:winged helix-turn-helix domain-containing protein [Streptomyces sp. NBC_00872]